MNGHPTMDKGHIGVAKVISDLTEKGYAVFLSVCDQLPFDLVAYKEGKFSRIQVKYRTTTPEAGSVNVAFGSYSVYTSGKVYEKPMNKDEVEAVAVYCPDTKECYYLDPKDFGTSATLRLVPPKNNQKKGVHMAANYTQPTF